MLITERVLRKWRKEALESRAKDYSTYNRENFVECQAHILAMTQELLDLHLINNERRIRKNDLTNSDSPNTVDARQFKDI